MKTPRSDVQLRKEVLVVRAALERLELARAVQELQQGFAMPAVLRGLLGQFTRAGAWPVILRLFQRYPIAGSALSMFASRMIPRNVRNALRALGFAVVAWQVIRLVRGWRPSGRKRSTRAELRQVS